MFTAVTTPWRLHPRLYVWVGLGLGFGLGLGWVLPGWAATGQLQIEANGEDFVRKGFVSKDGWALSFEAVKVHFAQVSALQTDPPYNPDQPGSPQITRQVSLPPGVVVDLQAPEPLVLGTLPQVPTGFYNALHWQLSPSPDLGGASILLVGTATKANLTLPFRLRVDQSYGVWCGEYIGEERRGILESGGSARLEATFHFDHLFGDQGLGAEAPLNQAALGFAPLAALAVNGQVEATLTQLMQQLSPAAVQQLTTALSGLYHSGEGHCRVEVGS